jgi:hypothetical protein
MQDFAPFTPDPDHTASIMVFVIYLHCIPISIGTHRRPGVEIRKSQ